jgi:site-specific DNA-methyltransferase (adenine-specific)
MKTAGATAYGYSQSQQETNADITTPATPLAQQWNGWGTALKPAHEPIVLAMKPLDGTFAANAEKHGVAGLNVDGCRIPLNGDYKCGANGRPSQTGLGDKYDPVNANTHSDVGRWPANLIHDGSEEVLEVFPEAGVSQSGSRRANSGDPFAVVNEPGDCGFGDSGSAARFFYCAKSDKRRFRRLRLCRPLLLLR